MTYCFGSSAYEDTQPHLKKSSLTVCTWRDRLHAEETSMHTVLHRPHSTRASQWPVILRWRSAICSKALLCKYFISHSYFSNCIGNKLPTAKIGSIADWQTCHFAFSSCQQLHVKDPEGLSIPVVPNFTTWLTSRTHWQLGEKCTQLHRTKTRFNQQQAAR